ALLGGQRQQHHVQHGAQPSRHVPPVSTPGSGRYLKIRPTPSSQAQKKMVRPARPEKKKTTTFIRSVPATIAIAKNGGKPAAAETKVSSPLRNGRPATCLRQ